MIELTVNGKRREIERSLTVTEYLDALGINPLIVAVEHNAEILKREQFSERTLQAGDVLEIVRMVGGGSL